MLMAEVAMPDLPSFKVVPPKGNLKLDDLTLPDGTSMVGPDGLLIPPARSFSMIVNSAARVYSYRFDEAMRDNFIAARAMRRDGFLEGLFEERILPTINRSWMLEVDDDNDPAQAFVRDGLTKIIQNIPDFDQFKRANLDGVWFGRAGTQWSYARNEEIGDVWGIPRWDPLHGDSLQFTFDGVPAVLLDTLTTAWYSDHGAKWGLNGDGDLRPTDRGGTALVLQRPYWRNRFAIHTHIRRKADYFEGELAGSVQGLGLRGQVYWLYVLRTDALTWMIAYMQAIGAMDLLVFNFPAGNDAAKKQQEANANKIIGKAAIVCPRNPNGNWPAVEQIQMNSAGLKALHDLVADYFDRHIERLFVGQSMSAGADKGTGLGGTGRAEFTKATKDEILVYDTTRLDSTFTYDVVRPLKKYNYPWAKFPVRFKSILPDLKAAEKVEAGGKMISNGVSIRLDEYREAAGYSRPEEGDEILATVTPGSPPVVTTMGPDGPEIPVSMMQPPGMPPGGMSPPGMGPDMGMGGMPPGGPPGAPPGLPPQLPPVPGAAYGPHGPPNGTVGMGSPYADGAGIPPVNGPTMGYPGGGNTYIPSWKRNRRNPGASGVSFTRPTGYGRAEYVTDSGGREHEEAGQSTGGQFTSKGEGSGALTESTPTDRPRYLFVQKRGRDFEISDAVHDIVEHKAKNPYVFGKYYDTVHKKWVRPGKRGPVKEPNARPQYGEVPTSIDNLAPEEVYTKPLREFIGEEDDSSGELMEIHRRAVHAAMILGKSVPSQVLSDYPEFSGQMKPVSTSVTSVSTQPKTREEFISQEIERLRVEYPDNDDETYRAQAESNASEWKPPPQKGVFAVDQTVVVDGELGNFRGTFDGNDGRKWAVIAGSRGGQYSVPLEKVEHPPVQSSRYERRNAPPGGIVYGDKPYRSGQFIPGTVMFQHSTRPPGGFGNYRADDAFDPEQLAAGTRYETQRTQNPQQARDRAKDNLLRNPDHYRQLEYDFREEDHPRDDHGRFVDKEAMDVAKTDPQVAHELRADVTKPEERAKLDAIIGPDQGNLVPKPRVPTPLPKLRGPTARADYRNRQTFEASVLTAFEDPRARADAQKVIQRLPDAVVQRLAESGGLYSVIHYTDGPACTDEFYRLEERDTGKPVRKRTMVGGFHDSATGIVHTDARDVAGTFAHEIGHAVDMEPGERGRYLTDSDEWRYIWSREMKGEQLSPYAATNPAEGFAEFCRFLWGNQASIDPVGAASRLFPMTFAYFQKHRLV